MEKARKRFEILQGNRIEIHKKDFEDHIPEPDMHDSLPHEVTNRAGKVPARKTCI